MPFDDRELDLLAQQRDQARARLKTCQAANGQMFELLRDAKQRYGGQIERIKSANQQLTSRIQDMQRRQKLCRQTRDYSGAESLKWDISSLRRERDQNNDARQSCVTAIRDARNRLDAARSDLESAKRQFEYAKFAFKERLEYLKLNSGRQVAAVETISSYNDVAELESLKQLMARAILTVYRQNRMSQVNHSENGRQIQYQDGDLTVIVKNGYHTDGDVFTTDIVIYHRDPRITQHIHALFDEYGNQIMLEWRNDH